MTAHATKKMTVDEYLAWAEGRPGRYELHAGIVYALAPEWARHAEVKLRLRAPFLPASDEPAHHVECFRTE